MTGAGTPVSPWQITFASTGVNDVPELIVDDEQLVSSGSASVSTVTEGGPAVNESQAVYTNATGGTFTLAFGGQTTSALSYQATAAQVKAALEALSTITTVNVTGAGTLEDPWQVTFVNPGSQNVAVLTASGTALTGTGARVVIGTLQDGRGASNEAQSIALSNYSGFFTIELDGRTTSALASNASTAAIQTALQALGAFTASVTGAGTTASPWQITFTNPVSTNIPPLLVHLLKGVVSTTVPGTSSVPETQRVYRDASVTGGKLYPDL